MVDLLRQPPKPPKPLPPPDPLPPVVVDPDAVELVIDDDGGMPLADATAKLQAAYARRVPGKKLRVRWWWE